MITLTKENNEQCLDMFVAKATPALIIISPPKKALQSIGMREPGLTILYNHITHLWVNMPVVWHKDIAGHVRDAVILLQEKESLEIVFEE